MIISMQNKSLPTYLKVSTPQLFNLLYSRNRKVELQFTEVLDPTLRIWLSRNAIWACLQVLKSQLTLLAEEKGKYEGTF